MKQDNSVDTQLARLFRHIDIRHRKLLMRGVSGTELHRAQHMLLMTIARHEGASQCLMAKEMEISTAAVTVSMKKLEKRGYIYREVDEEDNRYNRIYATEAGKQLVRQSHHIFEQIDKTMFEGFSEEEKLILIGYYNRILDNIKQMEEGSEQSREEEES